MAAVFVRFVVESDLAAELENAEQYGCELRPLGQRLRLAATAALMSCDRSGNKNAVHWQFRMAATGDVSRPQ